jgi:hypothetical protein
MKSISFNNMTKFYLLFSVFFLLFCLQIFASSLHNVDICQNDMRFQEMIGGNSTHLMEFNISFGKIDIVKCYLSGLKWTLYAVYGIILSAILFVYS